MRGPQACRHVLRGPGDRILADHHPRPQAHLGGCGRAVLAAVILTVAMTVFSSGASAGALTRSSTCTQWSSANHAQQSAYSRRYIGEHAESGFLSVSNVTSAIDRDCLTAAYLGESDDVSVAGAIKHAH